MPIIMAKEPADLAGARLRHLFRTEPDYGKHGWKARVGTLLGTDGMFVGKIEKGASIGVDTIAAATRQYGISADYFFDPGDDDLDHLPYRKVEVRKRRAPNVNLEAVMVMQNLGEPAKAALRSIEWGDIEPTPEILAGLCTVLSFARAHTPAPMMPGPAMLDAVRSK